MAKEIFFTINSDSGGAVKSIKELEDEIKKLQKEWKAAEDPIVRNKIGESLKSAKNELKSFNDTLKDGKSFSEKITSSISSGFKQVSATIGGLFVADKIISFGQASVKAFKEAEISATALRTAVKGVNEDFIILNEQATQLEGISIFQAEDIQAIQTAALQFGLTVDQVKKLTPVVVDLASATGQDLNSAFNQVLGGLKGQQKALSDYRVQVDSSATVQERFSSIIDQLNVKFKGQSQVVLDAQGGFSKLSKEVGNIQEDIGQNLIAAFNALEPIIKGVTIGFLTFVKAISAIPAFLAENKGAFIALTGAIIGFNAQQIIASALSLKQAAALKLQQAQTFATTVATKGLNTALKSNPIGLVITLVTALVGAFITLYENSQTVRAGISGLFNAAKTAFTGIATLAQNYLTGVGDLIIGIFTFDLDKLKEGANRLINGFKEYGENVAGAFTKGFKDKVNSENTTNQATVSVGVTGPTDKQIQNTRDSIKSRLGEIDIALSSVEIGSETETKLLKEKADLQAKLDAADNKRNANIKTNAQKNVNIIEQFQKKVEELNKKIEETQNKLAENQKEITEKEYQNKIDATTDGAEKIKILTDQLNQELLQAQEEYNKKSIELAEAKSGIEIDEAAAFNPLILKKEQELRDKLIKLKEDEVTKQGQLIKELQLKLAKALDEANKATIENIEKTNNQLLEASKVRINTEINTQESKLAAVKKGSNDEIKLLAQIAILKKNLDIEEAKTSLKSLDDRIRKGIKLNQEELSQRRYFISLILKLEAEKNQILIDQDKQLKENRGKVFQEGLQEVMFYADAVANALTSIINFNNDQEQARIDKLLSDNEKFKEVRLAQLEEEYSRQKGLYGDTLALEKTYQKTKLKIEEDAEKKRQVLLLEAWKKDKEAKSKTAFINTAVAIGNALATTQPFIPNAIIAAAIAALQGGLQVSAINSTQPPQFQDGGILYGPSHSNGGIPLMSTGGRVVAEAEGGEIILNKNVSKNPRLTAIASAINSKTGGVAFSNNYDPIANAILRSSSFEKGGIVRPIQRFQTGGIVEQLSIQEFNNLNSTLNRIDQRLQQPPRAYVIEQDITSAQNLNALIERRSKIL